MELVMNEKLRVILSHYKDELWMSCRLKLGRLIEEVEASSGIERSEIDEWLRFIKFLDSDCSGISFTCDKQWSELLILMQINRKLNHRTVRFSNILSNKRLIEAAEGDIRRLNASAKLFKTIDESLVELNTLVQACTLSLPRKSQALDKFLPNELTTVERHLKDQCLPLLYLLELELNNELIRNSHKLSSWQDRMKEYKLTLLRLQGFVRDLQNLETELVHLKPLMLIKNEDEEPTNDQQVSGTIESCRQKFGQSLEFHNKLIESLYLLSREKDTRNCLSLRMTKLLNSRNEFVNSDLYNFQLLNEFRELLDCRAKLDKLMQNLRLEFGRFYFVNDFELLTIISLNLRLVTENTPENKRLICKLFNNSIASFLVDVDQNQLVEVRSPFEEIICLRRNPVTIRKKVNLYSVEIVRVLNDVTRKLRSTLRYTLTEYLKSNAEDKSHVQMLNLPVQLIILADYVKFCEYVELELNESKNDQFSQLIDFYENRLKKLNSTSCVEAEQPKCTKSWLEKFKESSLISVTVHFLTLLMRLKAQQIASLVDWEWQKQVKFRHNHVKDELEVLIGTAKFLYKYDYLPLQTSDNSSTPTFKRLINTQTSERCFLTASKAVNEFKLGANPYGPAGSGKTETIKALGQLLGCHVIVHNCDESNDSESLDRLVWGLAHTGFWGCFDEFNRLSSTVLSSVSASLELVQSSIREKKINAELPDGTLKRVDPETAFFITLNPVGGKESDYKGRRRLPANLRHLFIPIAMMRVEIHSIVSELLLTMSGELGARLKPTDSLELGNKFHKWMEKMLVSKEIGKTIEWDLRFVMATLKRFRVLAGSVGSPMGDETVSQLLVKSIEFELEPRLPKNQLTIFRSTLNESFSTLSKMDKLDKKATELEMSLREMAREQKLANENEAARLALNLSLQLETHTGVLLLGLPGTGKSTTWRLLHLLRSNSVKWIPLNPRACEKHLLFGYFDEQTKKWIDGLLTAKVRESLDLLHSNQELTQIWLILDGPIEPDWIESLNSVLDDNKVLTLGSGERLNFFVGNNQSVKLIFETDDIRFASPATISRLGLVIHETNFRLPKDSFTTKINFEQSEVLNWNQLITSSLSVHSDEPMKKLKLFLTQQTDNHSNLCAIVGDYSSLRSDFVRISCTNCSYSIEEFNCSRDSSLNDLLELLTKIRKQSKLILLLNNIHLIQSKDCWKVNGFIELLRFIITYRILYDVKTMAPTRIDIPIIMTADSLDLIDGRIWSSLGMKFQLDVGKVADLPKDVKMIDNSKNSTVSDILFNDQSSIVTLSSSLFGLDRRREIVSSSLSSDTTVFSFQNHRISQQALEALEENVSTDLASLRCSSKRLFILSDFELELMDERKRSKLLCHLNWFKKYPNMSRFIFLTHNIHEDKSKATFWSSLSSVYHFQESEHVNWLERLNDYYTFKISSFGTSRQTSWLSSRTVEFIKSYHINLSDRRKLDAFLELTVGLINRSTTRLTDQSRALKGGLENLKAFEDNVERVKTSCNGEERKLIDQRKEIELLIKDIDAALKVTQEQRDQVSELKLRQDAKAREISEKSSRLERELAEVARSLENSRADISQYLKPEALNEIKTLRSPPKTIKDILDVLFVLLGVEDLSWHSVKAHLARSTLREELTNYDPKKRLNESLLVRVNGLIEEKHASFTTQQAARASKAILPLLGWIKATLDYGRVLVKLKPLNEEMDRLRAELTYLNRDTQLNESRLLELDTKIKDDDEKLKRLNKDYEESQRNLEIIKQQLTKAKSILTNLGDQVTRWKAKLATIETVLDNDELVKLSITAAAISVFHDIQISQLVELFKLFELNHNLEITEFLEKLMNLIIIDSTETSSLKTVHFRADELKRVYQLVIMRILIDNNSLVPFIDVDNFQFKSLSEKELVRALSFKTLLSVDNEIVIIRMSDQFSDWNQSIGLSLRLNKLVVMKLNDSSCSLDLDIADHVLLRPGSYDKKRRVILTSKLNEHTNIRHLVRPIKLVTGNNSNEEVYSTILDHLLQLYEPELMKQYEQFEKRLLLGQTDSKKRELKLLNKMATTPNREARLNEDLVIILNELHQLSVELEESSEQMKTKLQELQLKQADYIRFSNEASQFYTENLANLGRTDTFYHMSVEKYIELLSNLTTRSSLELSMRTTDYQLIVEQTLLPMKAEHKLDFIKKLKDNQQASIADAAIALARQVESQLKQSILEQLDELTEGKAPSRRLMIVLHDSTKSSPQLEVDELFRGEKRLTSCNYSKIYATCERSSDLLESSILKAISKSSLSQKETVECICLANAHLATRWINARFIKLLELAPLETRRILFILISESTTTAAAATTEQTSDNLDEFDQGLLEHVQVKYWYDELTLDLAARFRLFSRLVSDKLPTKEEASNRISLLKEQLVLFHVVCQELSKENVKGWNQKYNFDYNQLNLAFESLLRLNADCKNDDLDSMRDMFCHQLNSIIYGSRMESSVDEETLSNLVERIFNPSDSSEGAVLAKVELLEVTLSKGNVIGYETLLNDLIGLSG